MAVTVAPIVISPEGSDPLVKIGPFILTATDVTLDASYPTGGYAVTPQQLGLPNKALLAWVEPKAVEAHNVVNVWYDTPTSQLKAYTTAAEVANAVDLHTVVVRVYALGY